MKSFYSIIGIGMTAVLLLTAGCGGVGGYGGGGGGGGGQVATITISPTTSTIAVNGTQQYTAVAKDSNGNTISGVTYMWTSSSNGVATVNSNGLATGVTAGTAMITASVTYTGGIYGMGTTITSNSATLTVSAAGMVMGTATMGRAFAGALVSLNDSSGQMQTTVTDTQGRFQLAVSGMQAPYILKLTDNQGHVLFSLSNAAGVTNVDPFTDVIARLWYQAHGSSVQAAFAHSAGQAAPDDASLKSLDTALAQFLTDAETAEGLDPATLSLLHTPFSADGSGLDGLLDHTLIAINGNNIVLNNSLMNAQAITISTANLTVTFHATGTTSIGMTDTGMIGMSNMNMDTMPSSRMSALTIHLTH